MSSLSNYYKKATLIPLIIAMITGFILSTKHDSSQYQSEWSTTDGFDQTVVLTIVLSCLISLLSLSIFLTKYAVIKVNAFLSMGTWIFIPSSLCIFVIYQELLNFTGQSNINDHYPGNRLLDSYILSVAFLHLLSLIVSYLHFRFSYNREKHSR